MTLDGFTQLRGQIQHVMFPARTKTSHVGHTQIFFLFSLFILQCESSQCSENIFQLFNKNIKEGTPFTGGETSVLHRLGIVLMSFSIVIIMDLYVHVYQARNLIYRYM